MLTRRALLPFAALALVGTGSCVKVLDIESDRYTLPDPETTRWDCYATTLPATGAQDVEVFAVDLFNTPALESVLNGPPVSGAIIQLCSPLDSLCDNPVGNKSWTTDARGRATIQVPAGFEGYIQIQAEGFSPRIIYDDRMRTGLNGGLVFAYLQRPEVFSPLIKQVFQLDLDPTGGFVYSEVYDCTGEFAMGISFEVEQTQSTTRQYYLSEGIPNPTVSETIGERGGGFVNAPEGNYRLVAKVRASGKVIVQRTINVRGGWDTTAALGPAQNSLQNAMQLVRRRRAGASGHRASGHRRPSANARLRRASARPPSSSVRTPARPRRVPSQGRAGSAGDAPRGQARPAPSRDGALAAPRRLPKGQGERPPRPSRAAPPRATSCVWRSRAQCWFRAARCSQGAPAEGGTVPAGASARTRGYGGLRPARGRGALV